MGGSLSQGMGAAYTPAVGAIRRLLFLAFFLLGGFLFYIPKWVLFGTRGERQRKKILRELERQRPA